MRIRLTLLIYLFLSLNSYARQTQIFINEFQASNITTFPDIVDFDDYSDWIELYNPTNTDVSIGGYYLSDDSSDPTKWQIPTGATIPANGYYLVWADDYDDAPGNTYIRDWWPRNISFTTKYGHTNFKLSKSGEFIGLYDQSGQIIDSITFGTQVDDVSFGRSPDGAENWVQFGEPTPLTSNNSSVLSSTEKSGEVIFSQSGGFYSGSISISLQSSSGQGTIRYTLDSSVPTSNSPAYSYAISISENTVIRARVFENGLIPGNIITQSYLIDEPRNLPAFSINLEPEYLMGRETGIYRNTIKERELPVNLEYFPASESQAFSQQVGMRIGGENIYRFAQKPLNLYARGDYGESVIDYQMFNHQPYQAYKRLYLRNSGDDWPYSMIRDGMISTLISGQVQNSVQAYQPAVLYLNNRYWGIYNLREKLDAQYFSLHYNTSEADLDHLESNNVVIEGDSSDFVALVEFATNNDLANSANYEFVSAQIDVQNLMDFVIVQSYLANSSWGHNREMWRDRGNDNKWRWVLVDMDRGFNTSRISSNQLSDIISGFDLFAALLYNTKFRNEFVQRYSERVNSTFDSERVKAVIDSLQDGIRPEINRHIEQWGTFIDSLSITEWGETSGISSLSSWENEVEKFRTFAEQRPAKTIQNLTNHFGLGDQSTLTVSSENAPDGKVSLNSFVKNSNSTSVFFNDIPLSITAFPPPGYSFKSWKSISQNDQTTIIPKNGSWKYFDGASEPTNWASSSFDDSNWNSGNGILGYGDNQQTEISYGSDSQNKYITAYFRSSFEISSLSNIDELELRLLVDDGAVVYINGVEVIRSNLPSGSISNQTEALSAVGGTDEDSYTSFTIPVTAVEEGVNTVAVEVHQSSPQSSDLSFDLNLNAIYSSTGADTVLVSNQPSIEFTLNGNTELIAEFESESNSYIPPEITSDLVLDAAHSPYYITENVHVVSNATLTIEEGVELLFNEDTGLYINGALIVNGSNTDSATFAPFYPGVYWSGIFLDEASDPSSIEFAHISYAEGLPGDSLFFAALSASDSEINISHTVFSHVPAPVSSQFSDMKIDSSTFRDVTLVGDYINVNGGNFWLTNSLMEGNNIEDMDALDIGLMSDSTIISGNTIHNFVGDNSDAIDVGDASTNVKIFNNYISYCGDKAVSIGQGSEAYIYRNVFAHCNLGVGIKDEGSHATIDHTTFYANNVGVALYEKVLNRGGGTAVITNSAFVKSTTASVTVDEFSEATISYSLSTTDILDGANNLEGGARLINPAGGNFYPQVSSKLIDAGNPNSPDDKDGSRTDIGAFSYQGFQDAGMVINEINYNSADDFDTDDWVEFYNNTAQAMEISNWVFVDASFDQTFVFPEGTFLPSKRYNVIVRDSDLFSSIFGTLSNAFGEMETGLSGSGESLYLYNSKGFLVDSLTFTDDSPWPTAADGDGPTLELKNPNLDNALSSSWQASPGHGTPGADNSTFTDIEENESGLPTQFKLYQNYPNPFNPSTNIRFQMPVRSHVRLAVYDLLGREITVLVDGEMEAGFHQVQFDASNIATGMYIYQLKAGNFVNTNKLSFVK